MKLSPNEITEETNRVSRENYNQFVKRVDLRKVRGFTDQHIEYKYPVTAIIGTNGGGKSTILGATALAYKSIKPGQFFPKSFAGDDSMADWEIVFELIDKPTNKTRNTRRQVNFKNKRWNRDALPEREVIYIPILRTVPASEISKFKKFIGKSPNDVITEELSADTIKYSGAILDKNISGYRVVHLPSAPDNKMYVGKADQSSYSQFHFGAGEASIIATVDRIERSSENSLILIEEVENGLHPVAVQLFVQYLLNAAKRKRLQIIFTTHSQDAINQMPDIGIWASINCNIWNGKLSIESLRAVTGHTQTEKIIFVEDEFAKIWVENALGRYGTSSLEAIKVYTSGGYPNITQVLKFHNDNPATKTPAIALVDGDIYDPMTNPRLPDNAHFLDGGCPETTVFDYIFEHRTELSSLIRQRCLLTASSEETIIQSIISVRNSACDPHQVFERLSEKLNFVSSITIRNGMIDLYNEKNEDAWKKTVEFVDEHVVAIDE